MEVIDSKIVEHNAKELKVRVEEPPERQCKRQNFWRAVDALKAVAKEDEHFVLAPASFKIYDAKDYMPLGE
eukprot:11577849-Karenia_brevis.AAC.1